MTNCIVSCYINNIFTVADLIIIWVWRKGKGVIMAQFQVSINSAPTIIGLPPYTERVTSSISIGWHGCYLARHVYWSYLCLGIWSADVVLI
ncbi:hypothetical protein H8356DRAFT_1427748 [Neocallimastix lanati (nom. inval.)]|nr:hypothetical protein H8356DRAFT_1427748 [Neocallimastix sp. JGI-2020a]